MPGQRVVPHALAMLLALSSPAWTALVPTNAYASVSIAVTWEGLLRESTAAAIVTPVEARSVWEGGRVYTYTRVHVDRPIAGELGAGGDAWVRTMGGVVGTIGQLVEGEAVLANGRSSLLFLHPGPAGTLAVTARGQGQFPIVADADPAKPARVVRSNATGELLPPQRASTAGPVLAGDMLHGRVVDDAVRSIVAAWSRLHAG
ncbi:MAG: hypothetical protein ACLP1X_34475 [Polyangiaceae bacterium]|jgi:hypothetical protein